MWGVIPAAGAGSRIRPLAFSKELLPVGSRGDGEVERPRAVSEYLLERMLIAGVDKICFVVNPGKLDIIEYYGGISGSAALFYAIQPHPEGLCDSIFRALPLIDPEESVCIGLPDTIWFPEDGFGRLATDRLSFLLFPVEHPEYFDAVVTDDFGRVLEIQVKSDSAVSHWVWGAFRLPGSVLRDLHTLWLKRNKKDEYIGTLVNEYLRLGGEAAASRYGEQYVDVGTLHGYREASRLLEKRALAGAATS